MSYIGNTPISVAFLTDTFSGNGSTTAFTMTVAPANTSSIIVAITGVLQDPSTYSVSGTTLTFSAAPPTGTSNISVRYLGIPASGVTTTAYRTVTNFTATAGQTSFSTPSYTVGYIDVYRNGVRLVSTDFTATTGTTVVLTNACTAGDTVVTESFYVSSVLNAIPATAGAISLTSATYLTGQLPVANGGTGLSTVPHTVQVFTSGSGTYTTPANCKAIWVRMAGGGGGGGGTGTASQGAGGSGGTTTFGSSFLTCNGGGGGTQNTGGGGNISGGSATGGDVNFTGGGAAGISQNANNGNAGTSGGSNSFGGAGAGARNTVAGNDGVANTGAGGGGAGGGSTFGGAAGGGAGGYLEKLINSPNSTYSYAIGAGGTAGAAGTSGSAGGAGAAGIIYITEYYV
jgi:hypothetical protein